MRIKHLYKCVICKAVKEVWLYPDQEPTFHEVCPNPHCGGRAELLEDEEITHQNIFAEESVNGIDETSEGSDQKPR